MTSAVTVRSMEWRERGAPNDDRPDYGSMKREKQRGRRFTDPFFPPTVIFQGLQFPSQPAAPSPPTWGPSYCQAACTTLQPYPPM